MAEAVHSARLLRFGTFEVDLPAGELRKSGVKLKLSGQPFQVLTILLERPGEVVTREELQKRLWPNTFVDVDHNLNTAINKIREVLGDSAESPRFVETLPRRGYRFIALADDVKRVPADQVSPAHGSTKKNWIRLTGLAEDALHGTDGCRRPHAQLLVENYPPVDHRGISRLSCRASPSFKRSKKWRRQSAT